MSKRPSDRHNWRVQRRHRGNGQRRDECWLDHPVGIAVSENDLFVVNYLLGTIGEYSTSGQRSTSVTVTGLWLGIAVSRATLCRYGRHD